MNKPLALSFLLVLTCFANAQEVKISLKTADVQSKETLPYRAAVLSIVNDKEVEISKVSLKWKGGGPKMVYPSSVPAGGNRDIPVLLPAVSVNQDYRVILFDRNEIEISTLSCPITWASELVTRELFIDPMLCQQWMEKDQLPSWPGKVKRNLLIVTALSGIILAGVLFIPRPAIRIFALVAIVLAASAGVWFVLTTLEEDPLVFHEDDLIIVKCRNTCNAVFLPKDTASVPQLAPVYCASWQMEEDRMVIDSTKGGSIPMTPDVIRVFRKTGR